MEFPAFSILVLALAGAARCGSLSNNATYVGCYDVTFALAMRYHHHIPGVNFDKCTTKCEQLRTRYAGIGASNNFCYCGGDIAEESVKRGDSECDVRCLYTERDRTCGGDWLMSLYELSDAGGTSVSATENLSFLIGLSAGVRLYNLSNLASFDTVLTTSEWAYSVDYHYEKNMLFVYSRVKLYRTPLIGSGAHSKSLVMKMVTSCEAMAVDWVHDKIFWVDCDMDGNTLMSVDLNGTDSSLVMRRPEDKANIKRMVIDPYAGMLFWTADGVVESYDISEDNFRTNVSQPETSVRALAVDLAERRIYYVGTVNQTTSLFSVDYQGEDLRQHFSVQQLRSVYGLGLHAGHVYWVNYAYTKDILYSAPLDLQGAGSVKTLRAIDKAVWHMRVVHPDLQKPPRRDPCQLKDCSHDCLKLDFATARCLCPSGMTLHTNGSTCIAVVGSALTLQAASGFGLLASVGLVAAVLLVSGLLLYLVDTYWSPLQSELCGIPYARTRSAASDREACVTPEYHASQDNVVLI